MRGRRSALRLAARALVVALALVALLPPAWAVASSLKPGREVITAPLALPSAPALTNYRAAIEGHILRYWAVSVVVAAVCVTLIVLISALASHAFSRLSFRGGGVLKVAILAGMMVPVHAVLIPLYVMSRAMHLHGTPFALVGPYVAFGLPLSVLLLTAYFAAVPREIEDAARIDGCSEFGLWTKVMLPMSRPGLLTVAIAQCLWVWNEFPIALVLVTEEKWKTLPVGLVAFRGEYQSDTGCILASVVIAALPMLLLFFAFQSRIASGLTAGALRE